MFGCKSSSLPETYIAVEVAAHQSMRSGIDTESLASLCFNIDGLSVVDDGEVRIHIKDGIVVIRFTSTIIYLPYLL